MVTPQEIASRLAKAREPVKKMELTQEEIKETMKAFVEDVEEEKEEETEETTDDDGTAIDEDEKED